MLGLKLIRVGKRAHKDVWSGPGACLNTKMPYYQYIFNMIFPYLKRQSLYWNGALGNEVKHTSNYMFSRILEMCDWVA